MTDDTSYFIGFDRYSMAYFAMLTLNSAPAREFLMSSAFLDAKRPYTKKVLGRFDFHKAFDTGPDTDGTGIRADAVRRAGDV